MRDGEGLGFDREGHVFLATPHGVGLEVEELNDVGLVLQEAVGVQFIRVPDFDARVELFVEAERSGFQLGDDLNDHAAERCGVHGLKGLRAAQVKDAEPTKEKHEALLTLFGHALEP